LLNFQKGTQVVDADLAVPQRINDPDPQGMGQGLEKFALKPRQIGSIGTALLHENHHVFYTS
jgi:hypothetical protein